jgi:hypothetical protein
MLTCTYRGLSYQVPSRQSKTQELGYDRNHYIERMNEAQKRMTYRGIRHSLVVKVISLEIFALTEKALCQPWWRALI